MKHRSILEKLQQEALDEPMETAAVNEARALMIGMNIPYYADAYSAEQVKIAAAILRAVADKLSKFDTKKHKKFATDLVEATQKEINEVAF